jgi:hypothetical protein
MDLMQQEGGIMANTQIQRQKLIRWEPASAHKLGAPEVDVYDGQGRFATFLVREDAEAMAALFHVAKIFTQYVAKPDECGELREAHDMAERVLQRFERMVAASETVNCNNSGRERTDGHERAAR